MPDASGNPANVLIFMFYNYIEIKLGLMFHSNLKRDQITKIKGLYITKIKKQSDIFYKLFYSIYS